MYLSTNMDPFPNAASASDVANSYILSSSSSWLTTLMPRPPPPYAAFSMIGYPNSWQNSLTLGKRKHKYVGNLAKSPL